MIGTSRICLASRASSGFTVCASFGANAKQGGEDLRVPRGGAQLFGPPFCFYELVVCEKKSNTEQDLRTINENTSDFCYISSPELRVHSLHNLSSIPDTENEEKASDEEQEELSNSELTINSHTSLSFSLFLLYLITSSTIFCYQIVTTEDKQYTCISSDCVASF